MYTLLHGLYKHVTQKDEFFVLILGLDNAGKTTFLESAKTRNIKYLNCVKLIQGCIIYFPTGGVGMIF